MSAVVLAPDRFRAALEAERSQPLQRNLFTGETDTPRIVVPETFPDDETVVDEGISLVKTEDLAQLILSGYGLFLGKKSERLIVKRGGDIIYQFPLFRIQEVIVASKGISISTDVLQELCIRGIRLNFSGAGGAPYAMISSPHLNATIQTRRDQLAAFSDKRGFEFSRAVVEGKIRNQEKLLRYFAKYLKKTSPDRFEAIESIANSLRGQWQRVRQVEGENIEQRRGTLMGLEGVAGRMYWEAVAEIIRGRTDFLGREHRGATDTVNAMLNYGYGILNSTVWGSLMNAGLEPFAGFLHSDRSGKPSLVLDLVEEFRQPVVDRAVLSAVNLGMSVRIDGGLLDRPSRESIGARVLERLTSAEPYRGKQYQVRSIIQMQARRLASFLRGGAPYKAFSFKW